MKAVIPELIIKCLRGQKIITTEGLQTREFNFVEDLVSGFVTCSKTKRTLKKVYNIGSNYEIRIKDLVLLIHELTDSKSELGIGLLKKRKTDISRMKSDYSKFNKETGWKPRIKLTEGLKITIEWYKKYLHLFEDPNSDLTKIF
jgi:nucleoside-diphosphate-sugar epimerase